MTAETWRTLIIMVAGSACTTVFNMWLFRWRKKEETQAQVPVDVSDLRNKIAAYEKRFEEQEEKLDEQAEMINRNQARWEAARAIIERIRGRLKMNGGYLEE